MGVGERREEPAVVGEGEAGVVGERAIGRAEERSGEETAEEEGGGAARAAAAQSSQESRSAA